MSKIDIIVSNVINSVNNFLGEHHNESLTDAQKDNLRRFVEALPGGTDYYELVDAILVWSEHHDCTHITLNSSDLLHRLSRAFTGQVVTFRDKHVKKMAAERYGLNPANPVFQFFDTKQYLVHLADSRVFFLENPRRMSEYFIFDFNVA